MIRRHLPSSFLLSTAIAAVAAAAAAAVAPPTGAHVTFRATGPAGLKIEGQTADLALAEESGALAATVQLGALTTGIDLRDRHMREKHLETARFPSAKLVVQRAALKLPAASGEAQGDAPGALTLHGQTRPVNVHYTLKAEGTGLAIRAGFHVEMTEFGIAQPSYLGVHVKPGVDVEASFRTELR